MATKKSNKSLWVMLALIAAIIAVILLLPSCGNRNAKKGAETDAESTTLVKSGDTAPDFTVEMVDGSSVTLGDLKGKVVLLNFWATWCPPCRQELTRVQTDIIDRFAGKEFVFLPVSRGEKREAVEAFREKTGYAFPMGLDPAHTGAATPHRPGKTDSDRRRRIASDRKPVRTHPPPIRRTVPVPQHKKSRSPTAETGIHLFAAAQAAENYFTFGPAVTSFLPSSLPVNFTKFFTKRLARSSALTSQSLALL